MSTVAAKQQDTLQQQITIAERHPDLRACLTDRSSSWPGGTRTLPMPNLSTVTVEQADALVASCATAESGPRWDSGTEGYRRHRRP